MPKYCLQHGHSFHPYQLGTSFLLSNLARNHSPPAAMATCVLLSLLLFAFIIFESGNAHKILVYNSKFGHSHSNYLGRISDILADAGHNVVCCLEYFVAHIVIIQTSLIPIMDGTIADGTTKSHVIHVQPDPRVAQL